MRSLRRRSSRAGYTAGLEEEQSDGRNAARRQEYQTAALAVVAARIANPALEAAVPKPIRYPAKLRATLRSLPAKRQEQAEMAARREREEEARRNAPSRPASSRSTWALVAAAALSRRLQ